MNDSNQQDKKGISNGFILFLIAVILGVLMLQNFLETQIAKVSFSYQLEHLVNLDLIRPEESRKTAIHDNLATFSGHFREQLTDLSKKRYKFLELLNEHHELQHMQEMLTADVEKSQKKMEESASFFLSVSGLPIPSEGYAVTDQLKLHSVKPLAHDLPSVKQEVTALSAASSQSQVEEASSHLEELLNHYRSTSLGIGNEAMKQSLREMQQQIAQAKQAPDGQRLQVDQSVIKQLEKLTTALNQEDGGMRLLDLRPMRHFRESQNELERISRNLEDNQVQLERARQTVASTIWYFNDTEISTRALEKQDVEQYSHWFAAATKEWENFKYNRGGFFRAPDQPINTVLEKTFRSEELQPQYTNYFFPIMIGIALLVVLYALFARQMRGMGNSAMNFGKSPARLILPKGENRVTFKDVAGVDEALEELQEIVEFLRSPQKFTSLGGHIPKGVLCIGPPGTGKTLIAKAVAGEANRPFFSISGSDFVEMFVGVGASRIRDLFEQAKKNAPCIIFMDEIDAVGRHRGVGIGGGHDEREQTLNQLLVEMDGFDTNEGVILMAATNRPDVLDKALLRPGRFDRRVIIGLPDIKGRLEILKVHARKIKIDEGVDLMALARTTPGCSGADLMNMLNEAALLGAKRGRTAITMQEIMEARDKVLYGKERRNLEIDENEKKTTAYHEAGHAIVGLKVEHGDPIDKITIIPRGMSLGATMFMPEKNRVSYWKKELHDQLAILLGGRAAEEIFVKDISSGAQSDIERATEMARNMVCLWGMSDKLGTVAYDERQGSNDYNYPGRDKKYSQATAEAIDAEVKDLVEGAHQRAVHIIEENRAMVEVMTQALIKFETLDRKDVELILNGQWSDEEKEKRLKIDFELHKQTTAPSDSAPPPAFEGRIGEAAT